MVAEGITLTDMQQNRRHNRTGRGLLDLEEGNGSKAGASSAYSNTEISEQDNEQSLSELEERARLIKQLTKDIKGEVDSQNKFLENLNIQMENARRKLGGTVERFTKVFETKSNRHTAYIVGGCVLAVVLLYFLTRR
eukprot:TRINITY_DN11776_c0_g1_i1.p2 TRINITY_DN11776_c0_g1~~TRINITY_DN11776_c0_g1_i1.p2  ORF type:complete len:137 (-),score=29.84 TRINITY_DN11776_c0_g1_i1:97-507(-)